MVECFHKEGVAHLKLDASNIFLDNNARVHIGPPDVEKLQIVPTDDDQSPKKSLEETEEADFSGFADMLRGWILKKVASLSPHLKCLYRSRTTIT